MGTRLKVVVIALILALATFLRFYKLTDVPISLYSDEVATAYNAYSILETGRDEFGQVFPISFRSFNDYKPPLATYLVAGSQALFGISDWAVRFPNAFLGVVAVALMFLLCRQLKLNTSTSLIATILFAINPWHLMFSRAMYESLIALTFILLGSVMFLKSTKKPVYLIFSSLFFSISLYSYHSARVFVPLLVLGMFFLYRREVLRDKTKLLIAIIVGLAISFPLIVRLTSPQILVRPLGISILSNPPSPNPFKTELNYLVSDLGKDGKGVLSSALLHNRRLVAVRLVIDGYLKHVSPAFLFSKQNSALFEVTGTSLFYLWEIITISFGAVVWFNRRSRHKKLLLLWLFLSPLAAGFAFSVPSPVRSIFLVVPLTVLSAVGFGKIIKLSGSFKALKLFLLVIPLLTFYSFTHNYFVHYADDTKSSWDFEYKQLFDYLAQYQHMYAKTVFVPEVGGAFSVPHVFLLYYLRYPPDLYLEFGGSQVCRFGHSGRYNFGRYEFRTLNCKETELDYKPLENLPKNSLLVVGPDTKNKIYSEPIYKISGNSSLEILIYETNKLELD